MNTKFYKWAQQKDSIFFDRGKPIFTNMGQLEKRISQYPKEYEKFKNDCDWLENTAMKFQSGWKD